jgi:hypothetical protein
MPRIVNEWNGLWDWLMGLFNGAVVRCMKGRK